jgi:hypothetical protein
MISLTEIQLRFESAILSLAQAQNTSQPKTIPTEVKMLAQTFKKRVNNIQVRPEELVVAFMNILVMASESGIDLETKTLEVLMELEHPSFFGS